MVKVELSDPFGVFRAVFCFGLEWARLNLGNQQFGRKVFSDSNRRCYLYLLENVGEGLGSCYPDLPLVGPEERVEL